MALRTDDVPGTIPTSPAPKSRANVFIIVSLSLLLISALFAWNNRTCDDISTVTAKPSSNNTRTQQPNNNNNDSRPDSLVERLNCFAHRFSYHCDPGRVEAFIAAHADEFLAVEEAARLAAPQITQDILIMGNSHTGQVGEALICALREHIVHFSGTDLYNGCLTTHVDWQHEPCDGGGKHNRCGIYLATATLTTGARIHVANNHPWLFGGPKRLTAGLDHMHVRPDQLGTLLLGSWNPSEWAQGRFADKDRDAKRYYPIAQLIDDFVDRNGHLRSYSRCGGGFANLSQALLGQLTLPWRTDDLLEYFDSRGFVGRAIIGNARERVSYDRARWNNGTKMRVYGVPPPRLTCMVPHCRIEDQHHCMPGEPFLFIKYFLDIALSPRLQATDR